LPGCLVELCFGPDGCDLYPRLRDHPSASVCIRGECRHLVYFERSPSGTGLKAFGFGNSPKPAHTKFKNANGLEIELYQKSNRYFTVTGLQMGSAPQLRNIDGFIDRLDAQAPGHAKANGATPRIGCAIQQTFVHLLSAHLLTRKPKTLCVAAIMS
jgi:hypothetical protein